jgi:hypothetical protein
MEGDPTNLKLKFDSFVNQNIESVLTHSQNMDPHPVDKEALESWRDQMIKNINLNEDLKYDRKKLIEWTNRFADNLTCISHEKFLSVLKLITYDLITELENTKFKTVVLCVEKEANKSSIWLAILMWSKIRNYVTHVMSFKDANAHFQKNTWDGQTGCIIHPDDAAYSGKQYKNYYEEIHSQVNIKKHFILIPYISETARNEFNTCANIWISQYSISFKSLYSNNETELRHVQNRSIVEIFCGAADVHGIPDRHVLYFDHKLADRVSLYTQVIAYSPILPSNGLNPEQIIIGKGFIKNCTRIFNPEKSTIEILLRYATGADREKPLCPNPIYKYLSYTFNTKTVKSEENLLEFIKINTYMCYNCTKRAEYVCGKCFNQVFCGKNCQIKCI